MKERRDDPHDEGEINQRERHAMNEHERAMQEARQAIPRARTEDPMVVAVTMPELEAACRAYHAALSRPKQSPQCVGRGSSAKCPVHGYSGCPYYDVDVMTDEESARINRPRSLTREDVGRVLQASLDVFHGEGAAEADQRHVDAVFARLGGPNHPHDDPD